MTDRLGYWLRFGLNRRVLHVARWDKTADGVLIVSACGLQLIDPTTPSDRLQLAPTAVAALQAMDAHQAARLCKRCRGIFTKGTP